MALLGHGHPTLAPQAFYVPPAANPAYIGPFAASIIVIGVRTKRLNIQKRLNRANSTKLGKPKGGVAVVVIRLPKKIKVVTVYRRKVIRGNVQLGSTFGTPTAKVKPIGPKTKLQAVNRAVLRRKQVVRIKLGKPTKSTAGLVIISPSVGQVVITGQVPTLLTSILPSVGSIVITGQVPGLVTLIGPSVGSVVITGNIPGITLGVNPTSGSVLITGQVPTLVLTYVPTVGSVVITGQVPTVNNTGTTFVVPPEGQVIISGNAPSIVLILKPSEAQVVITGFVPQVTQNAPGGPSTNRNTMFMAKHVRKQIRRGR